MPKMQVDPAEYTSAAHLFATANNGAVDAMTSLIGILDGCAEMAGSDSGGQQWAGGYDEQARQLVDAGATIANGLGTASELLSASGANHATADGDSTPGSSGVTSGGFPGQSSGLDYYGRGGSGSGVESVSPAAPPSANGGDDSGKPHGWFLIEHLLTYTWPNGHQDKLRQAGSAWSAAADAMTAQADLVPGAISQVNAQQSAETPDAVERLRELQSGLVELGDGYRQMGSSANEYAQHLDDTHHEIISEVESLLAWTIASEATGALLSVFTAGLAEAGAQAAVAARCAVAATRIGTMIERLIEIIGGLVSRIVSLASRAVEIANKVKAFVGARASAAAAEVATRLPGAAKAADAALMGRYTRYFKGLLAKGKTPKSFTEWKAAAEQAARNRAAGVAGVERSVTAAEARGETVLGREITIDTAAGRVRPDIVVREPDGRLKFIDSKNGPTADLTSNQRVGYPSLEQNGGIPAGQNAANAGLEPGVPIGPTRVQIDHWGK